MHYTVPTVSYLGPSPQAIPAVVVAAVAKAATAVAAAAKAVAASNAAAKAVGVASSVAAGALVNAMME